MDPDHVLTQQQSLFNGLYPSATREKDPGIPEVLEHRVESRPRCRLRRETGGTREELRRRDRGHGSDAARGRVGLREPVEIRGEEDVRVAARLEVRIEVAIRGGHERRVRRGGVAAGWSWQLGKICQKKPRPRRAFEDLRA